MAEATPTLCRHCLLRMLSADCAHWPVYESKIDSDISVQSPGNENSIKFSRMRVCVYSVDLPKLYDSGLWPLGVVVRPWSFKSRYWVDMSAYCYWYNQSSSVMAQLNILSFNCHGFNMGTLCYLRDKCVSLDIVLLQETWLSNENSWRLDDISPNFVVVHSSAMEHKLHRVYLVGRPYEERQFCTISIGVCAGGWGAAAPQSRAK